jgi:hypothetical protein
MAGIWSSTTAQRVLDPQDGRRGKKFATSIDDVEIEDAWVWQEGTSL